MTPEDLEQLLHRAASYTARYEKSPKEVREKLEKWSGGEISKAEAEAILGRLKSEQFISEGRYAERYIRDKIVSYRKGPYLIRRELLQKGIPEELIEQSLAEVSDAEWIEALEAYLTPRLEKHRKKARNSYDLRMRMQGLAYQRGYPRELLDELLEGLDLSVQGDDEEGEWWD